MKSAEIKSTEIKSTGMKLHMFWKRILVKSASSFVMDNELFFGGPDF